MTNREHLQILQQGVKVWNAWRDQNPTITPDLAGVPFFRTHLPEAKLFRVNFSGTNLTGADFSWADLSQANLADANLTRAHLADATCFGATFIGATLTQADLQGANLTSADFTRADISKVDLAETIFGNTNLAAVRGLETCRHLGASILDHRTLARSGAAPPGLSPGLRSARRVD